MFPQRYIIIAVILAIAFFIFNMTKKYKIVRRDPVPIVKKKKVTHQEPEVEAEKDVE
jgi:hypothetical protein